MTTPLLKYTKSQQDAIDHVDGNLQVIACAGSGKTQVLAQRIVNLLRNRAERGLAPENIVAFTFTEKAAGELKDRIYTLCQAQIGDVVGLADMFVGTIHAFCLDLLQTYQFRFLKYRVLNDVQQRQLIDRYSKGSGLTDLTTHDGKPLKRWTDSRLYQRCLSVVRESQIDEAALGSHPIRAALQKYIGLLDDRRYLDYSRILTETVTELAGDSAMRTKIAARVKYLIVDEYQDVNPLQEALIRVLHQLGAQVCVVGDDDQTIYQWNGSDIQNIVGFAARFTDVHTVPLAENFRSSEGVVETARKVVERNPGRLPKKMVSMKSQAFEHGDALCLRFDDPAREAAWIVEKLLQLRGGSFRDRADAAPRGLTWSDCAVLYRSVKNSAWPIVDALRTAGIPYVMRGVSGLFDTAEAQAARGLFLYLAGTIDKSALVNLWRDADLGIKSETLSRAVLWLDAEKVDWPNRQINRLFSLQNTFQGFLERVELREDNIPGTGTFERVRGEIAYYNLGKFSQVITDFEEIYWQSQPQSLYDSFAGFLTHQAADYYPEGWEDVAYHTPDAIQIMTIHQAKGMEFPVVFVPNLVSNRFPTPSARGRQWWHVIPPTAVVGQARYRGSVEDERRLFYVALTRSKKYLYCTWAPEAVSGHFARPSPFVAELTASTYLAMIAPRLALMRNLLAETGAIFVHADVHVGPYLKVILDELFGKENFQNEIAWYYYNKMHDSRKRLLPKAFDQILYYVKSKNARYTYHPLTEPRATPVRQLKRVKVGGRMINARDQAGNIIYQEKDDRTVDSVWRIRCLQPANKAEWVHYETQKPVDLIERIIDLRRIRTTSYSTVSRAPDRRLSQPSVRAFAG